MVENHFHSRVYYRDVDQMGIVYYSRYFEYFEQARTELLNCNGISISDIESEGITLPVTHAYCEYFSSARFEDRLIVRSQIKEIPSSRLKINYFIKVNDCEDVIITGYTVHAFMKKNGKPTRVPKILLDKINHHFSIK